MSDNNGDLGAFLAGFVIGGLVGAAVALIMAPQSGEETRAQITSRGEALRRSGEERFHAMEDSMRETSELYRSRAHEVTATIEEQARIVLDSGRQRAGEVSDEAASALADTADTMHEAAEEIKRSIDEQTDEDTPTSS